MCVCVCVCVAYNIVRSRLIKLYYWQIFDPVAYLCVNVSHGHYDGMKNGGFITFNVCLMKVVVDDDSSR